MLKEELERAANILRRCVDKMNDPKHRLYLTRKARMIKRAYVMLKEAMEIP